MSAPAYEEFTCPRCGAGSLVGIDCPRCGVEMLDARGRPGPVFRNEPSVWKRPLPGLVAAIAGAAVFRVPGLFGVDGIAVPLVAACGGVLIAAVLCGLLADRRHMARSLRLVFGALRAKLLGSRVREGNAAVRGTVKAVLSDGGFLVVPETGDEPVEVAAPWSHWDGSHQDGTVRVRVGEEVTVAGPATRRRMTALPPATHGYRDGAAGREAPNAGEEGWVLEPRPREPVFVRRR